MCHAVYFPDPLDSRKNEVFDVVPGQTVNEFLDSSGFRKVLSTKATLVRLNGEFLSEAEFDTVLEGKAILALDSQPQGPALGPIIAWIAANWVTVALVVASAVLTLGAVSADLPATAESQEGSSTYSIGSRGNRARLGQPIPRLYGTHRTWPDLAAHSYSYFANDEDQFLVEYFEISQGLVDVDMATARYEDTPFDNFEDKEYEVLAPGEKSTLYPTSVVPVAAVSNIDLEDDPLTAIAANAPSSRISRVAFDMSADAGIYKTNKDNGELRSYTVRFKFVAQEIDDNDNPVGSEFDLADANGQTTFSFSNDNRDPIRRTYEFASTKPRIQVYPVRLTAENDSQYVVDGIRWVGLKGFLEDSTPPTSTTRVVVKVRASNQLSNTALSQFSVVSSARLSTWDAQFGWTDNVLTNNPAWAFADACRSDYGGRRPDNKIDLPVLAELADFFDQQGYEFNGIFDTRITVWDVLKSICATCRCVPIDSNGIYTMVLDDYQAKATEFYSHRNIKRGSFNIDHASVVDETADAINVSYYDKDDNYRQKPVLCALPGSPAANVEEVNAFGISDHEQAYLYGIRMAASNQYRRERVSFDTGMAGKLPGYGSLIGVSHFMVANEDAPQISGDVISWNGVDELVLSEPVDGFTNPYLIVDEPKGSPTDPMHFTVLEPNKVKLTNPGQLDPDAMVWRPDHARPSPMFAVGEGVDFLERVKVDKITSLGRNRYKIHGFVDDINVYTASDGLIVPDVSTLPGAQSVAPSITNLTAVVTGTTEEPIVNLSWQGANSDRYHVGVSDDAGAAYDEVGTGPVKTTSLTHRPDPGSYIYRVAGANILRGPWVTVAVDTSVALNEAPPAPTNLALREAFEGAFLKIGWESFTDTHLIVLEVSGVEKHRETITDSLKEWDLYGPTAQEYGVGRTFDIKVYAVSSKGKVSDAAASLNVTNTPPAQLNNVTVVGFTGHIGINFDWPPEDDVVGISVWKGATPTFTPSNANRVVDRSRDPVIGVPVADGESAYYVVAAVDVWGDSGLNYSGKFQAAGQLVDLDPINAALATLDGKFPISNTEVDPNFVLTPYLVADLINSLHIVSGAITSEHIEALSILANHIAANSVTADKISVAYLSALAADLGLVTAGTFQTTSGTGSRAELSSSGDFPLWIGTGLKTSANGHVYYDKTVGAFVIQDPGSGYRIEVDPGGTYPIWIGSGTKNTTNALVYLDKNAGKLIGKKIQAGELVADSASIVKTLHLEDQAVTFRASAYSSGYHAGSTNNEVDTQTVFANCTGAPGTIEVSLSPFSTSNQWQLYSVVVKIDGSPEDYRRKEIYLGREDTLSFGIDVDLPAGGHTIKLHFTRLAGSGGMKKRRIAYGENKR